MNNYRDKNGHWTTKENNNGECYHNTDKSNKIVVKPINFLNYKNKMDEFKNKNYPDGTYNINGKEITNRFLNPGFQVSIFRPEIYKCLLNDEIEDLIDIVNEFLNIEESDIGFFGNQPEVSSFSKDYKKSMFVAKLFNQYSILPWKLLKNKNDFHEIKNPYYNPNKTLTRNDYLKGLKLLKEKINETK